LNKYLIYGNNEPFKIESDQPELDKEALTTRIKQRKFPLVVSLQDDELILSKKEY